MKRFIVLLLMTAMFLVLLAGCSKPVDDGTLPDDWVIYSKADEGTFSEHGYYYTTPQGVLYFLDLKSGGNVALCNRIGCKHELETYPEEDCEAYLTIWPRSFLPIFYESEKLYYVASDYYGLQLYSRNADGTAKTHITTLGQEYSEQKKSLLVYEYLVYDGMLYYTAEVSGEVKDDLSNTTQITREFDVLRRVDLRTGKEELLVKDVEKVLELEAVGKNTILYRATTQPDPTGPDYREKLISTRVLLNVSTGNTTVLMEKQYSQIGTLLQIENNTMYLQASGAIATYDIKTGESKESVSKVSDSLTVLNAKYALCYDADQMLSTIYDLNAKTFLPGGVEGLQLGVRNVDKNGFIVQRNYPKPGGGNGYWDIDYYYLCYCSFASLSDGFQESDLIPFHFVDID